MSDKTTSIQNLKDLVSKFVNDRDWEQFHSPKNLSMSIAIESAELMEKFQWIEAADSKELTKKNRQEIEEEIADIATYILNFCALYNIDLSSSIQRKLKINSKKYPVYKSKGISKKYTEL